jgi:hypothetical protein
MRNAKGQHVRCRYGLVLPAQERQIPPPLARARHKGGQGPIPKVAAMKFATARPYSVPEAAAHKLIEIANAVEAVQDGRIHIELLNGPMLFESRRRRQSTALASSSRSVAAGW